MYTTQELHDADADILANILLSLTVCEAAAVKAIDAHRTDLFQECGRVYHDIAQMYLALTGTDPRPE